MADSSMVIRMAPKLTSKHIDLPPFAPLRVKLATQVLSHSVAAGISAMCSLGGLPEDARYTAEFVEGMERLFNCFNSSTKSSTAKMRHALTETSGHIVFLKECSQWTSTVKSQGKRQLPCLTGWSMAISCLLLLWEDLHAAGVKFLLTNRLNQDCLENLFSVIRGKGGNRDNPDPVQFKAAFRQVMVDAVMVPNSGANCLEDLDAFLLTLKGIGETQAPCSTPFVVEPSVMSTVPESVRSLLSVCALPEDGLSDAECNIIAYIAGYLCRKVLCKVCTECQEVLKGSIDERNPTHVLLLKKSYGNTLGGGLIAPSNALYEFVEAMEKNFREIVESVFHMDKVRFRIVAELERRFEAFQVQQSKPLSLLDCMQCKSRSIVLNLFVTVRLHHCLKESNRCAKGSRGRRNRKVLKFSYE